MIPGTRHLGIRHPDVRGAGMTAATTRHPDVRGARMTAATTCHPGIRGRA
ncbi:hypothetical protein AB4Z54_14440 [Streptomyces sp. MCAF7]